MVFLYVCTTPCCIPHFYRAGKTVACSICFENYEDNKRVGGNFQVQAIEASAGQVKTGPGSILEGQEEERMITLCVTSRG